MKQPIFFISDPSRKEQFILETKIWEEAGSLIAEKSASSPVAIPHLNKMLESYKYLSGLKKFNKLVSVVPAVKKGSVVKFKFIHGESAERLLLEAILNKDEASAIEIIEKLISIINSLPSVHKDPSLNPKYVSVFGKTYPAKTNCTETGLVDLNLDNFIIDDQKAWSMIDYEWNFDFPTSKFFLTQRFIWWFIVRYRETFIYHSQRIPIVAIAKNLYVPDFIYKKYHSYFLNLDNFQTAESCFQSYVKEIPKKPRDLISFYGVATKVDIPQLGLEAIVNKLSQLEAQMDGRPNLIKINKELQKEKDKLLRENQAIISSRSYRLAIKMSSIKRRFWLSRL